MDLLMAHRIAEFFRGVFSRANSQSPQPNSRRILPFRGSAAAPKFAPEFAQIPGLRRHGSEKSAGMQKIQAYPFDRTYISPVRNDRPEREPS